jgi:putative transposase
MTAPRQILPGATYLITRRCSQRQYLLRPSKLTTAIFAFVLALAAKRFGVKLHAFCVMSNHFHLLVTDPDARLPAFSQYLNSLVARAVNATLGRWESFWAPASYSAVALTSRADVLEKAAYVLANPVAAGLVRCGRDWPGLWSAPERIGAGPEKISKPTGFFRKRGRLPDHAELELTAPPGFDSVEEFRASLASATSDAEERHRSERGARGRGFLGTAKVLTQRPTATPSAVEAHRGLNPRVAARDRWKRVEALARLTAFLAEYRSAWRAWRAGERGVLFPPGTYLLRVAHGVACAA